MKNEFIEYDNGRNTVPYGATSICFCLTDYAKKYIIEDRVITKGVNDDVRDAVIVDAINYLGTKGNIDFGLYTKDLYHKGSSEEYVDPQCLISAIIHHLSYYLFYINPVESVKHNTHMNDCEDEISFDDASYVVCDFINYLLEVNYYDRVFTLAEMKAMADNLQHKIEMNKLKNFLMGTSQYSQALADGEDIVKMYRRVSSMCKLDYIDKDGKYIYTPKMAKKLGRKEMFSWDSAPAKEMLYSMMYAYGKMYPDVEPKNQSLQRILKDMRTTK